MSNSNYFKTAFGYVCLRRSITPRTFNGREATSGGQGAAAVNRYDIPLGVQEGQ